jgi:hypothetical protein
MLAKLKPVEVWSLRLNPSDLYNIERVVGDDPTTGGGDTYIQVPARLVHDTLVFLGTKLPKAGAPIFLSVKDAANPSAPPEDIEFWIKSDDQGGNARMRIARQNRHRHKRFAGWAPAAQFPTLPAWQKTSDAKPLLAGMGGVRIFLARDANGTVWGGFTVGAPSPAEANLAYAQIAWAPSQGGYWHQ